VVNISNISNLEKTTQVFQENIKYTRIVRLNGLTLQRHICTIAHFIFTLLAYQDIH